MLIIIDNFSDALKPTKLLFKNESLRIDYSINNDFQKLYSEIHDIDWYTNINIEFVFVDKEIIITYNLGFNLKKQKLIITTINSAAI